ncbi:RnfABCDGE type electron transport complex subunit D [Tannerella sp.]|uniref:RnfABCDGE type electron transport complex subunit D n=1 Tax=Tannerella sp. TaxID=2382127 RepID=UPI0026DC020A|nr:RnfABCDGE type electron transport complex subunit D [Tannerella sp.]MDO4703355.1 RnfABCDGE type electron transport complex subunit D [Tannerella sp.]
MNSTLIVSPSPHVHSGDSIGKNMYGVLIALVPAFLVSLYCFGLGALIVTLVSVVSCVLAEYLIQKYFYKKEPTIGDGSAILTGVLLAFNLPSNLPVWIIILGALFAIGVGKMSFGGLGNNIFNPALVGRVFLLISFPAQMTTWPVADMLPMTYMDAQTGATTLSLIHYSKDFADAGQAAIGLTGGSLGEMSEIALLIGFAYMLFRKIITWHIPVTILLTVAVFTGILYLFNPTPVNHPLIHLTSGGLMLGAVFMATDYVTSPMTKNGTVVYGIGIGVLTVLIRIFGAYPEGMSFSILIMNGLTPLINTYFKPKHFGGK